MRKRTWFTSSAVLSCVFHSVLQTLTLTPLHLLIHSPTLGDWDIKVKLDGLNLAESCEVVWVVWRQLSLRLGRTSLSYPSTPETNLWMAKGHQPTSWTSAKELRSVLIMMTPTQHFFLNYSGNRLKINKFLNVFFL